MKNGDKSCSIHTIHQIHNALNVSIDYLLYGNEKNEDIELKEEIKDKDILIEIVNSCSDKELKVLREVMVALYPNLKNVIVADEKIVK